MIPADSTPPDYIVCYKSGLIFSRAIYQCLYGVHWLKVGGDYVGIGGFADHHFETFIHKPVHHYISNPLYVALLVVAICTDHAN